MTNDTDRDLKAELDSLDSYETAPTDFAWPQSAPENGAVKALGVENLIAAETQEVANQRKREEEQALVNNAREAVRIESTEEQAKDRGVFGDSWGVLAPEDRQAAAKSEYDFSKVLAERTGKAAEFFSQPPQSVMDAVLNYNPMGLVQGAITRGLDASQQKRFKAAENVMEGRAPLPELTPTRSFIENTVRGAANAFVVDTIQAIGMARGYGTKAAGGSYFEQADKINVDPSDDPLYKIGLNVEEWVKKQFPGDAARQQQFAQQLAQGVGSTVGFAGVGWLGKLANYGELGTLALIGLTGAASSSANTFKEVTDALKKGDATEFDRTVNVLAALALGATEALPFAPTIGATMRGVGPRVASALEQTIEESLQEGLQGTGANLVKQQTYDPNQALLEGVPEGMAIGALTGGAFGGALGARANVAADSPPVQEARARTPNTATDATPVAPQDTRAVAPMMEGPAQKGMPGASSEPATFSEPELEAARKAIQDAAQGLPVELAPEGQPAEEQPQEATSSEIEGQENAIVPEQTDAVQSDAVTTAPTDEELDIPAVFAEVEDYLAENEIQVDDIADEAVREIAQAVYQGEDLGVAVDRALGLEDAAPAVDPDRQRRLDARAAATDSAPLDASNIGTDFRDKAKAKFETMPERDRDTSGETPEQARARRLENRAGATGSRTIQDPAAVRQKFAEVLASTTPRSKWAEASGVDPETLNTLIEEAVSDGRMEIRFGKPVRKAAARVAPVKPQRPAAPTAAPAMLRTEEKRLEGVKSDKAYTAAADLFNARGTPESFQAALDRLYSDKAVKNADLAQVVKAFTGKRKKPKNRQDAIAALKTAYTAWAARNSKGKPKNAERADMGQGPGVVPEGRVSGEVRPDAEGRDAEGTPGDGGAGRAGDVAGRADNDGERTGPADGVRGQGEEAGADPGDRAGTGEPRTDSQPAVTPPRERTPEEIAALEADLAAELEEAEAQRRDRLARNYRITDADKIGHGGPKQKVRANIAAIETLKKIEEEGRPATDEEKAILVKYVGWGAYSQAIFRDYNQDFAKERAALKTLLTPEEYKSARDSTINAHFTSPEVIKGMWSALEHMGFKGGRVLEPSVGIGHFIGLQPEAMSGNSSWTAVDLDTLSGRITKALYGAADVRIGGFEEQIWPNDHFDLAISNVPFAAEGPYDPAYKQKFTLHDYFFVKSLDKVRPGGIVAFITSSGTLDKARDQARREMEKRGTFLGAIRLPGGNKGAFKANAGTDVTTDIIFFRKKMQGEPIDINAEWTDLETVKTPEGDTEINRYFVANPDMMLGKMRLIGSMYSKGEPVLIGPTDDMELRIAQAAKALPENAMTDRSTVVAPVDEVDTATDGIKEGAFYEKDGKIFRKIVGVGVPQKLNKQDAARIRAFLPMRDTINEMLAKQASGDKMGMEDLRAALSASYDAFVKAFGPVNLTNVSTQTRKSGKVITIKRKPNFDPLSDDMDAYKVAAIESYDEKTGKAIKTAIFTEDLLKPYERPAITGPADALTVSLNEAGRVDMKLIANVLGVSEKRAAQDLGDAVFLNPTGEQWQTATQYLSGDVVTKLADAKAAVALDGKYARNVAALEAVQPIPLTRNEITVPFGASYVPEDVINAFLAETLEARGVQATLNPATKSWSVRALSGLSEATHAQWGTPDKSVYAIVEAALNSKPIQIFRTDDEGVRVRMPEAEELARAKVTMLKEAFTGQIYPGAQAAVGGWVWNDDARATRLEAVYNNAMNRLVKEQHDGSHLTFPGLARVVSFPDGTTGTINLPAARTGAIWRIIQNGNTLIDHVVGAGKTWTSIMAVQEMKRLGQIRRPMFVVPNHMLMQFSAEFLQAYPGAKLLVATKDSMKATKRAEFAAKAAAEKWDGIIITHSAFTRLKMQDAAYKDYYTEILSEMEASKKGEDESTVKDIVKAQKRIKTKLDKLIKAEKKDKGVTFEELGVDHITVDEAHLFKNLWFMTRHTRVKGISNSKESQRATDLYIKIRHLEKSRPGRSALFLTGTPLSNTMAEVYTMMKYLQRPTLEAYGISEFDSWAQTFGIIDTKSELSSNSKDYKDITSFSKFVNIPELSTLYGRIADTQTAESLGLERPAIKGGMPQVIMSEPSDVERSLLDTIIKQMEELKGAKPKKGAPNFLSMFTKGLQASTDARLVDPDAPFNPDGKIGKAIDNIFRIWEEGNKDAAKPDKGQIVFLDMGVPGSRATAKPMKAGSTPDTIYIEPLEAVRRGLADTDATAVDETEDDVEADDETEDGEELQPEANEDDAAVESMMAGKFNLYEDIKGHLVAKGMSADQIAFIHDAKNDDQKAKMFEAVREGKIRVIIGSTGKMGVGTNVQKRLIALHHIDAPWRPSDLEQRDGRILRQGNKNPEIQIYRYITQRSFEAYRWQILERKASFIAQFRAGARGLRIAEDIDSPLPDASEIKAAATGDSRIIEYAELERTVRGLIAQASAHSGVPVRARRSLEQAKANIARIKNHFATLERDAAKVVDLKGDAFKITANLPGGKTQDVTERKKAGQALGRYIMTLAQNAYYGREIDIEFGQISGFELAGTVKKGPDGIEVRPAISGEGSYWAESAFFLTEDTPPVPMMQAWERLVPRVRGQFEAAKADIAIEEAQIPALEAKTVVTPFPKQAELEEKQKRLVELGEALKPKKAAATGSDEDLSNREAAARARMAQDDYARAADLETGLDTSKVPGFWSENWKADRRYNLPTGEATFEEAVDYLFKQAVDKAEANGGVAKERKAFIVIGFGGAGKSTLANPLARERKAVHASADDAKLIIPEFDGGKNSGGVHEESSELGKVVLRRLIEGGYNIVLEKLGSNTESIGRPINQFKAAGYSPNLLYVRVPKAVAMERAIARFETEGRAITVSTYDLNIDEVFATSSAKGDVGYGTFEWQEPDGWKWGEVNAPDLGGLVITDRFTGKPIAIGGDGGTRNDALGGSGGRQVLDQDGAGPAEGTAERRLTPPQGTDPEQWLRDTLTSYGIDPAQFGTGTAKPLNNLVKEVVKGEAELIDRDGQLIRRVSPLALDIFADVDGKRMWLTEDRQEFSDGRVRRRGLAQSIGEKLEPGEEPQDSVARALEEELGITKFTQLSGIEKSTKSLESPSYPGIMSEYTTYKTSVMIDPSDYKPDYVEKQKDKTNYFVWQSADGGDVTASLAGYAEAEMPADVGANARTIALPAPLRVHARALFAAGLDQDALNKAITALEKDRALAPQDRAAIAQAYAGGYANPKVPSREIRKTFAERVHDVSLAELGGFDPSVSGSNLDWRPEARAALSEMAARLPEGVGFTVRNFIEIATRTASMRTIGLEIEGGIFTPEQAARQLGMTDTKSAKKIMAVSLAYGPDVALQTFTHEEIHVVRNLLTDKEWKVLSALATRKPKKSEALRLIDIVDGVKISPQHADFLRANAGNITYREIYGIDDRYGTRFNNALSEETLVEEVVAHAAADWADGHDFGTRIERVMMKIRDLIEALGNLLKGQGFETVDSIFNSIWSGEVAKRAAVESTQADPEAMMAIGDAETGRSMRRDLDALGYYSGALEAAKNLRQAKGTPEQMLAMLKKEGAKEGEISATGLQEFLAGKASVTKDEIVKHIESNKVALNEVVRARDDKTTAVANEVARRVAEWEENAREESEFEEYYKEDDVDYEVERSADKWRVFAEQNGVVVDEEQFDDDPVAALKTAGIKFRGGFVPLWKETDSFLFGTLPNGKIGIYESNNGFRETKDSVEDEIEAIQDAALDYIESDVINADPQERRAQIRMDVENEFEVVDQTKWSSHSLDRSNPTYRETVLHLPVPDKAPQFDPAKVKIDRKYQSTTQQSARISYDGKVLYDGVDSSGQTDEQLIEAARKTFESGDSYNRINNMQGTFRSDHFPEINIIGHMMTSMTKHEGKPVFTIDQIQSDWGQKLRDGGVRDEAKVAELRAAIKKAARDAEEKRAAIERSVGEDMSKFVSIHAMRYTPFHGGGVGHKPVPPSDISTLFQIMGKINLNLRDFPQEAIKQSRELYPRWQEAEKTISEMQQERLRLEAELRTAKAATPGNPLVNTTDQWVNTTLRRAIRQAAEAGAEYIAIPSGDTVLSYNPGDTDGMRGFYGSKNSEGIVPKNLRKLLTKLDRATPAPQIISTLDSPSGKTGLGKGFTLFKITDQVKESVLEDGQAMFSLAGSAKGARPEPSALGPKADAMGLSRVLAETDLSIYPDEWVGNHPYEWADEAAAALRGAIPAYHFRVERSGSAAGDSAYVKTPIGDIRISDHGAHPKPGILWQGPSDKMSPRKAVSLVANGMQETIDKLLAGPAPNRYGSPRPNWMTADQWRSVYGAAGGADDFMASLAGEYGSGKGGKIKAWHSTPAKFDKFDNRYTDEVGFHFGTKTQAHNRAYIMSGGNLWKYFRNWRDIPVEMDIQNPVRISADPGSFMPTKLAQQLVKDKIAPYELIAQVQDAQMGPNGSPEAAKAVVRDFLISKGYDAIEYPNTFEDAGGMSYMTLGTGNVRDVNTGEVVYSLAGDQNGTDVAQLNQAIDSLKNALGIQVTQNLFGVTIKAGKRKVRINPRSNILGQTSRTTGGVGVRRSRDIKAIAHEGGHSLELMLGSSLANLKAQHADALTTPFSPDLPMPKSLRPVGFSGLELDDVEQKALIEAVTTKAALMDMTKQVGTTKAAPRMIGRATYDEEAYRKVENAAGAARANLIRLVGKTRADALVDQVERSTPPDVPTFVQERFSPMGAPKRRTTTAPSGEALSEAFARWFEKYTMSRESAFDMAPGFFDAFEDLLEAEAPSVLEGMHTVQEQYKAWTKRATVEDLSSDVVSVAAKNTWSDIRDGKKGFSDKITGWTAEAYTGVIDDLSPVQQIVRRLLTVADRNGVKDDQGRPISLKVSENPYKIARMFRGSYATGYTWIKDGIPNFGEEKVIYPGLQKAMETIFGQDTYDQQTYQAFGQYLISKRAIAEYDRLSAKKGRLADIASIIEQGTNAWRMHATEQAKERDILDRRQAALDRVNVLVTDRTRALGAARTAERKAQERIQELRDDLAEALRAIDDGSDVARATRDRRRRSLQLAERNAKAMRNDVVDIELELQGLTTDQAMLKAEIEQRTAKVDQRQATLSALENSISLMRREQDATSKRGASRPPTFEAKEWHEEFLAKVARDKRFAKFEEAAQIVYGFTQGLLTIRYQAGLIPEKLYQELSSRKGWYVPFMRDMSDAPAESVFTGGSVKSWSPFKKFDGSDRAIINPLEILSQESYAAAQHIAMNEAVGALAALAQKAGPGSANIAEMMEQTEDLENNPETFTRIRDIAISMGIDEADATLMAQRMETNFANEDLQAIWSPGSKGPMAEPTLPLWQNGERKHVVLRDPEFAQDALEAMKGMGKEQMGWIAELFGKPARWLQLGVTTHPTFMPRNLVRDVFDAWIKTGALPVVTQIKGARELYKKDGEFLRQYTAAGGILGGRNIAALTSKEQQANVMDMDPRKFRIGSALAGTGALGITGAIMGGPLGGLAGATIGFAGSKNGGLLKMVEAIESMTRLGVAAHAYDRAKQHNPNLTEQEAMLEAAFVARDVFDWNRRGSKTLALVRMITFLNAQIQGLDRAARAVSGSGDRGSAVAKQMAAVFRREHDIPLSLDEQRDLGEAYKTWARLGLYTALLLSLYAMYRDDDRYEDIKDGTKATHSWLPGFLGVDVRLPKAFEWAMPANFIEILWDKMEGRDPNVGERWRKSAQEVMVPPGVPQAFNLLAGWTMNTDLQSIAPWLFGESADVVNRRIVPDELKKLAPEAQFDAFTSQLSKDVALAMAKAGLPEAAIPSPKMIDFTLRTGGYWGQDIQKGYQIIKESAGAPAGPQPRIPDLPVVGGFTGVAARQSKSVEMLYRMMSQQGGDLTSAAATYKNLMDKSGNPAEAESYLNRLEPESRAYAILNYNFTASDKRRHPLERASAMAKISRDIRKDIVLDRLAPQVKDGRKTVYDFDNKIDLPPAVKTQVTEIMERLAQAESWNGFVVLGRPGWGGKNIIATKPILAELKAAAPDVFELYEGRVEKAKIEDFETIQKDWPKMREELLRNGENASF